MRVNRYFQNGGGCRFQNCVRAIGAVKSLGRVRVIWAVQMAVRLRDVAMWQASREMCVSSVGKDVRLLHGLLQPYLLKRLEEERFFSLVLKCHIAAAGSDDVFAEPQDLRKACHNDRMLRPTILRRPSKSQLLQSFVRL